MAKDTGISWTHKTQNFWVGCEKISPECAHCYIYRDLRKQHREPWGKVYRTSTWDAPWKWEEECILSGTAKRVFTCSESDFFHDQADPWRGAAWAIIKRTPHLVWLILTKRPDRIESHLPHDWGEGYNNVWLGVSVGCRQKQRLITMDTLRRIPAAVRFLSAEPLLEDISADLNLEGFDWVIAGGESGSDPEYLWDPKANWKEELENKEGRRRMKYQWATNLRDKVKAAGRPFLFKQVSAPRPGYGFNALDGVEWHEFPPAPNGLEWAPRKAIPDNHKMTDLKIQEFRRGGTYPFKPRHAQMTTRRWHPPVPSQRVFPELVPALLIGLGVRSKEAVADFVEKYGEGLTSEEVYRLNGWISVMHDQLLDKAKVLKGVVPRCVRSPSEPEELPHK